jgi:pre-mRNA-splicing helicase BRR2
MAFAQGGHLMSNKKCKLPEGSFKRSKKGYEEIHVPRPKQKPAASGEDSVPVSSLPEWTREAFGPGTNTLNRVQSKVFPVAFQTDEPILLCAPTGAGKVGHYYFERARADSQARRTLHC